MKDRFLVWQSTRVRERRGRLRGKEGEVKAGRRETGARRGGREVGAGRERTGAGVGTVTVEAGVERGGRRRSQKGDRSRARETRRRRRGRRSRSRSLDRLGVKAVSRCSPCRLMKPTSYVPSLG